MMAIDCTGKVYIVPGEVIIQNKQNEFREMKYNPDQQTFSVTTLKNFDLLGDDQNDPVKLREFVSLHFNPPGTELIEWLHFLLFSIYIYHLAILPIM